MSVCILPNCQAGLVACRHMLKPQGLASAKCAGNSTVRCKFKANHGETRVGRVEDVCDDCAEAHEGECPVCATGKLIGKWDDMPWVAKAEGGGE